MKVEPGQVKSIFLHAVENCARGEWGAYLDQACGENAELRRRVMILLDAHQTADSLIDLPEATATLGAGSADSGHPGTVIGPYKLLQPIGEGGMGTVYPMFGVKPCGAAAPRAKTPIFPGFARAGPPLNPKSVVTTLFRCIP